MFIESSDIYVKESGNLPFVLCTVGEEKNQHAVERPRGLGQHHLIIVTSGKGEFRVPGETFTLSEGEGVLWKKDLPHSYKAVGAGFDTAFVTFLVSDGVFDYYQIGDQLKFEAYPQLLSSIRDLQKFCEGDSTLLTRSAEGYSWFVEWLYATLEPSVPLTGRVRRFLEANYSRQISLDDVADAVHMSKYALCHYYKEKCGSTVMKTLQDIRISKAKELLRFGGESIGEVAQSCGFVNLSYFDKVFQTASGCTPHEYRVKHK